MLELSNHFAGACSVAIKQRRQKLGLSQDIIAKRSNLARSYICDVERGSRNPSLHNLCLIAGALETTPSEIIFETEVYLLSKFDPAAAASGSQFHNELARYATKRMSRGLLIADRQGKIVLVNNAATMEAGHIFEDGAREDWPTIFGVHRPDGKLFDADDLPLVRALEGQTIEGQTVIIRHERLAEEKRFAVNATPLRDDSGSLLGAMVVLNPFVA